MLGDGVGGVSHWNDWEIAEGISSVKDCGS